MKILVCFKVVRSFDRFTDSELQKICNREFDFSILKSILNSYDEAAIETALRISDDLKAKDVEVELHGITVGSCEGRFLTDLYAVGFSKLINIKTTESLDFDPEKTAEIICGYVKQANCNYDIVITGKQAPPGDSRLVAPLISSMLNIPALFDVQSIENCIDNTAEVAVKTDIGTAYYKVKTPILCAVGDAKYPYMRLATLKNKLAAKKIEPQYIVNNSILQTDAFEMSYKSQNRNCKMLEGSPEEIADVLKSLIKEEGKL